MTSAPLIALPVVQIVEITGPDAIAFAQAQFSSNLDELASGHWQWSAWLSAQGRVRAFFCLLRDDDQRLRLVLRGGSALALRDALVRYVLRAKVTLRVSENAHAFIERSDASESGHTESRQSMRIECDSEQSAIVLPGQPTRRLLLRENGSVSFDTDHSDEARNENARADIDAGLVTLDPSLEEKLLPAWIGLDALGATSTNKGCYPGQEIIARLHFKGGNKRWPHRVTFSAKQLPAPGTELGSEGTETGLIVCSAWMSATTGVALAILGEQASERLRELSSPAIELISAKNLAHHLVKR